MPSCTRILDHAGLASYDMVRREVLERKSKIGTLVHLATKFYDKGTLDWDSLDSYTRPRTEAWAQFRRDTGFIPRIIEEPYIACVNGMSYGLTVDREGILGGRPCVVEIKTTTNVEPWFAIQTAGYALGVPDPQAMTTAAIPPWLLFSRRRRIVVQLRENGEYKKYDFADPRDAEVFTWSLGVTHWKLEHGAKLRKIEDEVSE